MGAIVAIIPTAGCSGSQQTRHSARDWIEVARQQISEHPPTSETLQLVLDQDCAVRSTFDFEGHRLELVGSATALYGTGGEGSRYQCAFGGGTPANMRIEVVLLADDGAVDDYRTLLSKRSDSVVVRRGAVAVDVAEAHPDIGGRTFDAEWLIADQRAAIRMLIEIADPKLAKEYTPDRVADLFVDEVVDEA